MPVHFWGSYKRAFVTSVLSDLFMQHRRKDRCFDDEYWLKTNLYDLFIGNSFYYTKTSRFIKKIFNNKKRVHERVHSF